MNATIKLHKIRSSNRNLVQLYYEAAVTEPTGIGFVYNAPKFDKYWTWGQIWQMATRQADFLINLGLKDGDRVAIHSQSDWQWEVLQLSLFMLGVTVVGIDPNEQEQNFLNIYEKTKIKFIFSDSEIIKEKWKKFTSNNLEIKISIYPLILGYIFEDIDKNDFRWVKPAPSPQSDAIIIFTSGTTSEPKGILYSHRKVVFAVQQILKTYTDFNFNSKMICWLPLANLFQRMVNFGCVSNRSKIYFVNQPNEIINLLPIIKPDIFISVPRFYEKVHESFFLKINKIPFVIKLFVKFGIYLSRKLWLQSFLNKENKYYYPRYLLILLMPWDILFFSKFRNLFGGNIKFLVSGSAPMDKDLLGFYFALGLPVLEAYGTSENIIPLCANSLDQVKLGSVGRPILENSIQIAEDGEVLVTGDGLFSGYINKTDQNILMSSNITNGFYGTGDLGYLDKDGYLFLHGRKSEVFKTTTGKKVIVGEIESFFKKNNFIDHAVVVGMGRKFPLLFLTLDFVALAKALNQPLDEIWNAAQGEFDSKTITLIEDEVRKSWLALPLSVKPIGAIILTRRLSVENEEITLNLKIKRKSIEKRFQKSFDDLQLKAEKDSNFPILILNNEGQLRENFSNKPKTVKNRFYLLFKTMLKVIIAKIGCYIGVYSRSQYYRKVGQFLRISFGQLSGPLQKLAQMISHLSGEIPEEIREELGQLLHDAKPVDPQLIRSIVEKEWGKPISMIFKQWRDEPISTGSIGQVHWAQLLTGEEVAVKVLIPQIEKILISDLNILKLATPLIKKLIQFESLPYHIDELSNLFIKECDLKNEAENYKLFKEIHKVDPQIIVPKVYDSLVTTKVLVTEYIEAQSLDEFSQRATENEKNEIAKIIWETASRSINLYACFNADPHAGNFLIQGKSVVLIDFGFCKRWDSEFIENWKKQIIAGCYLDFENFEKYSRLLGIKHRSNPNFYNELLLVYQEVIYEPWLNDRNHEFNPEWLKKYLDTLYKSNISVPDLDLPKDFLALSRLYWGMFGIMANMHANANFYQLTIPYIESPLVDTNKLAV